ncbi:2,3,4,5-tetrahydropyridine-2,6-dicarboxylate N-succinyltransferase [Bradyrhizobium sacchari]|uniref:2,3,4,5-tetrahydropyridine-2,6-dicarboxylate N-succinyltransferase n=1 Tax=Bradyrhizobium sacchari TaxID=1399419 RepID=A0A560KM91_9BRAD|nr:2,3,4,5-tetrahydropyridine-2,6-dicarboxylate N-succinyltransferase [Bradyrhizobium sacchari]OPY96304.1 2,3,4,5-tetrahydropyridine-2,6-dicarboxylate N-succinyltransferase [Bradyrhizobium sacchari]TWB67040.1 2,3,4,5-tetrahydropyridine-2-carboxylate N-succinyltransferase [Bradyrhizobium sacchari]TWB84277.1 2,3,4,5-tetrahydropyridine-2-carboxylate N-succinyltransferase [Bradyrhizobium sacchari]
MARGASGEGFATIAADGRVLDSWFPQLRLVMGADRAATVRLTEDEIERSLGQSANGYARHDDIRNVDIVPIRTEIDSLASAPTDVHDTYLRLHLLSHRLVRPHCLNLEGVFSLLPNVAWTILGPCECSRVPEAQMLARKRGLAFEVTGVDKFPRMTDYVTPADVRIADADRVRLGAHLAPGTTVMHEGFCNFNAGTLGPCMVEGRISAGVVVGRGSDVGGGASIMGTLSGGGKETITVGERCLIGANAGIGISLGDDCVVEAGCYVTAGARVLLEDGRVVKARELSGQKGLLLRRNSQSGALEATRRKPNWDGLNSQLHG